LEIFQGKKKFVITLVLIAKCYFSWVHRERKKGLGGKRGCGLKQELKRGRKKFQDVKRKT
jgi:hypothetical protein